MFNIHKAHRQKAKVRIGLSGPSGSGKTYSALLLAYGMTGDWGKIAIIDSENGSADLYSHLGEYTVLTLEQPFSPENYSEALSALENMKQFEVIIIDSVSHEWDGKGGCLEINDKLAGAKFKGNTWAAWSETTPRHQKFIESIIKSPCHIITTARSKTDTIQTEDKKIKKVGLKEIQREGFEYELTANFNLDRDNHLAMASKDRTELFIDRDPFVLDELVGREIITWADTGIDPEDAKRERAKAIYEGHKETLEGCKTLLELQSAYTNVYNDRSELGDFFEELKTLKDTLKEKFPAPADPKTPPPKKAAPAAKAEKPVSTPLRAMKISDVDQLYKDIEAGLIPITILSDVIKAAKDRFIVSESIQSEIVRRYSKS